MDGPKGPLDPIRNPYSDSILDYIFDEECEGLMADIETIGLLIVEFWCAEGQPEELEGDFLLRKRNGLSWPSQKIR